MTRWLLALPALFWPRSSSSPFSRFPNYRPLLFLSNVSSRVAECTVLVESRPVVPPSRRRSFSPLLSRLPRDTPSEFPRLGTPTTARKGSGGSREDMLVLCGVVLGIFNYKGNRWLFFHVFPLLLAVGYCSSSKLNFICVLLSSNVVIYTFV